jgi:CheY-like chemotaxis protein
MRVARDGRDALQRLREECPDLIVLDLCMPVMDGWLFRTQQRYYAEQQVAKVPVLLMTGADDAATQADFLRAAGVITKPFDSDDFLHAVSAAIGGQRAMP